MGKANGDRTMAAIGKALGARVGSALSAVVEGMEISQYHLIVLLVILLGGITGSTVAYVAVKDWETERIESDFARRFDQVVAALDRKLEIDAAVLRTVAGLHAAARGRDGAAAAGAVDPSWMHAEGIRLLGWSPRIRVEQAGDTSGYGRSIAGFQIDARSGRRVALAARPEYFPVAQVTPRAAAASVLGFDLGSEPLYRQAMARARASGRPAATRRFLYHDGTGVERVVAVLVPVFGSPSKTTDDAESSELAGYAFGFFRLDAFLQAAMLGMEDVMEISVAEFDQERRSAPPEWIFGAGPETIAGQASDGATLSADIDVFGRHWTVYARPNPGYVFARRTWQAEGLLVAGLQFAALLDAYLLLVFGRTARVERLVRRRTAALQRSNHELKREMINRLAAERAFRLGKQRIRSLFAVDDDGLGPIGPGLSSADDELAVAKSYWALNGEPSVAVSDLDAASGGPGTPGEATLSEAARSPVAAMRMAAKILSRHDRLSPEEISRFVAVIVEGGERLSRLIDETLDLSSLEAARARRLKVDAVGAASLTDRVGPIAETFAARKGIEVLLEAEEGLPPVMADADRVVQVLMNLAENAVRFTQPGGRVRLSVGRHNSNYLRFSVTDSGLGMSAAEQATAFDAFAAEQACSDSQAGSVGLAVCKEIVERHGGTIWVDSRRGVGTTFSFILPVVNKRQAAAAIHA